MLASSSNLSYEEIEKIDKLITKVLNIATLKVECQKRNAPFTKKKVECQGTLLFWKAKVRQLKNIPIDEEVLEKRMESYKIECEDRIDLEKAQNHLKDAKESWNQLKEKGQELREKYLIDYHLSKLSDKQLKADGYKK